MMMTQPPPAKPQTLFEQSVRQALPGPLALVGELPWLQDLRHRAMARFENLGLPTRRQELWRYVDLAPVIDQHFEPYATAATISVEDIKAHCYSEAAETRLVFINGFYSEALSSSQYKSSEVYIGRFHDLLAEYGDKIRPLLAPDVDTESDAFIALNTASFRDAAFIRVAEGVKLDKPVQVLFYTVGDANMQRLAYPRLIVEAGENASVEVVVNYAGKDNGTLTLNQAVSEIYVRKGADVRFIHLQDQPKNNLLLAATKATLEAKSNLTVQSFAFGGDWTRHYLTATLLGEEAHATLNGLSVLNGSQHSYDHTVLDHTVANCTSDQLYKGILQGKSRSEFDGTIVIRKGAQQTNAAQLNQNLLLSDDAKIVTRPQLQIDADDVKCTHGATVGQLSESEVFYLRSRGLSLEQARAVLTFGFSETIIETVPIKSLCLQLRDMAIRSLSKAVAVK